MHATVTTGNTLFPVFLKLEKLRLLIVGGGNIAYEKISVISRNCPEAMVTVVAKDISGNVKYLALKSGFLLVEREFNEKDLDEKDLVITATGNLELSRKISVLAKEKRILANVADTPELCDFYLGSVVKKGDLKIAISTNGKSPTMAKRVREVLEDTFPDETNDLINNLGEIRKSLKTGFGEKVKHLNEITSLLVRPGIKKKKTHWKRVWQYGVFSVALMIAGHLLFSMIPYQEIGYAALDVLKGTDETILYFILGGFIAQLIDGALGMAYGVSATTFLLSFGIPPSAASASVHASEIFTSGVSGLMHLRFGNVNTRLFRNLLIPGVAGAIAGAYVLTAIEHYSSYIKPVVAVYTLFLGIVIIAKAIKKDKVRKKIKRVAPLAAVGGFLDSIGGGGWGPVVSSTLIAGGRNPKYTIGSVNLAEFFVALACSLTFISIIGFHHWQVVAGLITGGVIAAPIAVWLSGKLPVKTMMIIVGVVVIIVSFRIIFKSAGL